MIAITFFAVDVVKISFDLYLHNNYFIVNNIYDILNDIYNKTIINEDHNE